MQKQSVIIFGLALCLILLFLYSCGTSGDIPLTTPTPPPAAGLGSPTILFTDVEYGPKTGGPGGFGVPISIFGKGFGALRGSSTVTIGGAEVGSYMVWGQNNAHNTTLDMIVVQPGPNVTGGAIKVTVNGVDSNTNYSFTPNTAKVYYISTAGSDSAACSPAPCATILHTVATVMKPGDTVLVRGGTYQEAEIWIRGDSGWGGTSTAPKTIKRYPGEEVNLVNANRPFIVDADYMTVSGFNFQNGKNISADGLAKRFIDNTFIGTIGWDAIGSHGDHHIFAGNVCKVDGSTQGTQGHCYYISAGQNLKLLYNVGSGVPGYAIHIFDQRRCLGCDFRRIIRNVLVEGNILFGSPQRSGMIMAMGDEDNLGNYISDITIRNNIFTGNSAFGLSIQDRVSNVSIYNNTFYENGLQSLYIGAYETSTAPRNLTIQDNLFYQSMNNSVCSGGCWATHAHVGLQSAAQNITIGHNYYGPGNPVFVDTVSAGSPITNPDTQPITGTIGFTDPARFNFHVNLNESLVSGIGAY